MVTNLNQWTKKLERCPDLNSSKKIMSQNLMGKLRGSCIENSFWLIDGQPQKATELVLALRGKTLEMLQSISDDTPEDRTG